jgi:molybdate transport system substrate-binding protein
MKWIIIVVICAITLSCNENRKTGKPIVTVFCAASLTDVLSEIILEYKKTQDVDIRVNYASSGTLAQQIKHGAAADLFLSASKEWMDYISRQGLADDNTVVPVVYNSLVVIVPANSQIDTIQFVSPAFGKSFRGRLSVGDPAYVPAGFYAREAMQNASIFNSVAHRLLPAKDVRSALMIVEIGEAEAGIVYKTDALKSTKVKIVCDIPESLHQPVTYCLSILKSHKNPFVSGFYDFILSDPVKKIWKQYGFKT